VDTGGALLKARRPAPITKRDPENRESIFVKGCARIEGRAPELDSQRA
jgi:hypothetical protein